MKDFPKPNVEDTDNYQESTRMTDFFKTTLRTTTNPKKVAIIRGEIPGLAAAKYLKDAGHSHTVYEARDVLGVKVSAL